MLRTVDLIVQQLLCVTIYLGSISAAGVDAARRKLGSDICEHRHLSARSRLSAAMALTVCPVHLPVTESDRPACRGLDMRKVWKSATYQMDATPGASKPMSAASAHFEPTVLIGSSN